MTHKELADLLRAFADMVEDKAIEQAAIVETPQAKPMDQVMDEHEEELRAQALKPDTPSADDLKALLQTISRKYSSPEVRDTISNTIGDFKTANKMTEAERQAVHVALLAEYEI